MGKKRDDEIILSPKYGVNPTTPVCFWCCEDRGDIALLGRIGDARKGEDLEAPKRMILDYEPCEKCKEHMAKGFTIIEATREPNGSTNMPIQPGIFPTGKWAVVRREVMKNIIPELDEEEDRGFMFPELYAKFINPVNE